MAAYPPITSLDEADPVLVSYGLMDHDTRLQVWYPEVKQNLYTFAKVARPTIDLVATMKDQAMRRFLITYYAHSMDWLYQNIVAFDIANEDLTRSANVFLRTLPHIPSRRRTYKPLMTNFQRQYNKNLRDQNQAEMQIVGIGKIFVRPGAFGSRTTSERQQLGAAPPGAVSSNTNVDLDAMAGY